MFIFHETHSSNVYSSRKQTAAQQDILGRKGGGGGMGRGSREGRAGVRIIIFNAMIAVETEAHSSLRKNGNH
jgi:hypothetical protein